MADKNKPIKYLRYAIGEIVLVVIGILIALQINSWNQNRISKLQERNVLKNIHSEFLQNKKVLKDAIDKNKDCFDTTEGLIQLIGHEKEEIREHNIDSLLFFALETRSFRPSENAISDLLQSGRLQLLNNEDLKVLIYQWTRGMKAYSVSSERKESKIDNEIIPYLSKKYPLKDMDMYGKLNWKNKSLIEIDKLQIFEDIEFENIMDDYLYRVVGEEDELKELHKTIDNILKETATL